MEFLIEVDVTFTRTYQVTAESAERALEMYQSGDVTPDDIGYDSADEEGREAIAEPTNSNDFWTAEELGDTAVVYSSDGRHTLLIDVADAIG